MAFMIVPFLAAENDEPRPLTPKVPSSSKNGSGCRIDGQTPVQQTARVPAPHQDPFLVHRPPLRLLPAEPILPSLRQNQAPRRSLSWSAVLPESESDATGPQPPSTDESLAAARRQDNPPALKPILPRETPRCGKADRHPNQNRSRAVAGQIDRSSDHTVHLRLIPRPCLRQTHGRRHHHNSRTP